MLQGKYLNLSSEEYHGDTDSISRSAIMAFDKNPKKYWGEYVNKNKPERKTTAAMEFGEQFHALILEHETFNNRFCTEPTLHDLPKVGLLKDVGRVEYEKQKDHRAGVEEMNRKDMEKWNSINRNKKIISNSDYHLLSEMKEALKANKEAWSLLTDGINESSYFWKDPETGLMLKCRPDVLHGSMAVDLKTCKDASMRGFQRAMVEGGYHIQAAMIIDGVKAVDGIEIPTFINVCEEKEYPNLIGIYIIDDAAIQAGREKYKSIVRDMKSAREKNEFNDYPTQVVGLPAWYA